jgi:alanine racemase
MIDRGRSLVSLTAYAEFWTSLRKKVSARTKLMAVIKANAYGCGASKMASFLEASHLVDYLAVASCKEALSLRKSSVSLPLLTFSEPHPDLLHDCAAQNIEMSVWSQDTIQRLAQFPTGKPLKLHLNINTGMNRVGCEPHEAEACVALINQTSHLELVGVYTHFACAGHSKTETQSQLALLKQAIEPLNLPKYVLVHAANSDATLRYEESYLDMVRVGIESYMSIVTIEAKVLQVRTIKPGDGVGYDHQFVATKSTRIATVSIGYADGLPRSFKGNVIIQGKQYPVVGYVCMDMCMVDVGQDDIVAGDIVTFVGQQKDEHISLKTFAASSNRIPYESLCAMGDRLERVYT